MPQVVELNELKKLKTWKIKYFGPAWHETPHAYIALMSANVESPRRNYGDRLQLTNWILDSGATYHMKPEI